MINLFIFSAFFMPNFLPQTIVSINGLISPIKSFISFTSKRFFAYGKVTPYTADINLAQCSFDPFLTCIKLLRASLFIFLLNI